MKKKITAKELFESGEQIFAPCVYDAMTARAAERSGYKCLMLSGGAVAYSTDGQPDMAFGTLDEIIASVENITNTVDIPLIADFDDGYAESPAVIYRNVKRLIRAGASGFTLEDATGIRGFERMEYYRANPDDEDPAKKHPEIAIISREAWLMRIKAALAACEGTDCICIARTHAGRPYGWDEALLRAKLAKELGAPMTMVGGTRVIEQGRSWAAVDPGWKMWPDVGIINGKPAVELPDIKALGFNFVTMHVFEKSALYGMFKYAREDWEKKNVSFSNSFDMDGIISREELKDLMSMRREF
ncbi:MAG: isocitrate lyase/phosphoenolpyruvate mutase family protein [Lachnospiraceae bacterium]|nr:isocitrate lyase/phosphoenolpyruvate mutase family protein [Lachnospiraceae bacterium]